jgi:hypothetical protein
MNKPTVKLTGVDGNAYNILGIVIRALKDAGQDDLVEKFTEEATSGDYDHLLRTCFEYCDIE